MRGLVFGKDVRRVAIGKWILAAISLLQGACVGTVHGAVRTDTNVCRERVIAPSANVTKVDARSARFLERTLRWLNEPRLTDLCWPESYRLILLSSQGLSPTIVVRVNVDDDGGELFAQRFGHDGKSKLDRVLWKERRKLRKQEIASLRSVVTTGQFWQLPSEDPKLGTVLDGSDWMLEGVSARMGYHMLIRGGLRSLRLETLPTPCSS